MGLLDSQFTSSERRGLILLAIALAFIVGLVWLCEGNCNPRADVAVAEHGVVADSVSEPATVKIREPKRATAKKRRVAKPIEPRRNPLDEPLPVTPLNYF